MYPMRLLFSYDREVRTHFANTPMQYFVILTIFGYLPKTDTVSMLKSPHEQNKKDKKQQQIT